MSLLNKMKTGAGQAAEMVKTGAEQAATRARGEVEELQAKRELAQAYTELGKKTLELADRGDIAHPEVDDLVVRVHTLKAQLEAEH
jgi:hypothetical protein